MAGGMFPIYGYLVPRWWPPLPPLPLPLDGGLWPWYIWQGVATGPSCSFDRDGWQYHDGEQVIQGSANPDAHLKWNGTHVFPDNFEQPCKSAFIFEYIEYFKKTKGYDELTKSGKFGSYISGFLAVVNVHAISKLEEIEPCIDPCHAVGTIVGHRFKQQSDGTLETVTRVSIVCTE